MERMENVMKRIWAPLLSLLVIAGVCALVLWAAKKNGGAGLAPPAASPGNNQRGISLPAEGGPPLGRGPPPPMTR